MSTQETTNPKVLGKPYNPEKDDAEFLEKVIKEFGEKILPDFNEEEAFRIVSSRLNPWDYTSVFTQSKMLVTMIRVTVLSICKALGIEMDANKKPIPLPEIFKDMHDGREVMIMVAKLPYAAAPVRLCADFDSLLGNTLALCHDFKALFDSYEFDFNLIGSVGLFSDGIDNRLCKSDKWYAIYPEGFVKRLVAALMITHKNGTGGEEKLLNNMMDLLLMELNPDLKEACYKVDITKEKPVSIVVDTSDIRIALTDLEFTKAKVFGVDAFLCYDRINRDTIPEGWNMYELSYAPDNNDEESDTVDMISRNIFADFYGSILTRDTVLADDTRFAYIKHEDYVEYSELGFDYIYDNETNDFKRRDEK